MSSQHKQWISNRWIAKDLYSRWFTCFSFILWFLNNTNLRNTSYFHIDLYIKSRYVGTISLIEMILFLLFQLFKFSLICIVDNVHFSNFLSFLYFLRNSIRLRNRGAFLWNNKKRDNFRIQLLLFSVIIVNTDNSKVTL